MRAHAWLALGLWATPATVCAQPRGYVLELSSSVGAGVVNLANFDRSAEVSHNVIGLSLAAGMVLRTPHFASPYVELGYARVYRSTVSVTDAYGATTSSNAMATRHALFGLAFDLWRFRVSLGFGLFDLGVRSTLRESTLNAHEIDLGYTASLTGYLLRGPRWKVGIEARALFVTEANLNTYALLLNCAWDALQW